MILKSKYRYLIGVAFLSWIRIAIGNDANGNHAVWGLGQHSCNGFNTARGTHHDSEFKHYLMGYLTASNTLSDDTYSLSGETDIDGILTLIDKFCQKTPTDSYEHALQILVTELHKSRTRKAAGGQSWGR